MSNIRSRNQTIDIMKGIGVLLVLFGHAIQRSFSNYNDNVLFKLIYSFHMPLFIFLSGYVLVLGSSKLNYPWIKKKVEHLIIPFIAWYILFYLFRDFNFTGLRPYLDFSGGFIGYIIRGVVHPNNGIWFLWTLLFCYLIYFALYKSSRKHIDIFLIIISLLLQLFRKNYFGLDSIAYYFPIFSMGYLFSKYRHELYKYKNTIVISVIIFPVLFLAQNHTIISQNNNYIIKILDLIFKYILALSGIAITYLFTSFIKGSYITDKLAYLGRISLEVYVVQGICLNIGIGNGYLKVITVFLAATFICIMLTKIIKLSRLTDYLLFGNKLGSYNLSGLKSLPS